MRNGEWLVGFGCASAVYPTHVATATARVRLMTSGEVRVQTAAHEIGNGAYTVIAQMAAERLGVPLDKVSVELGDTNLPPSVVAGGSRTTASTCSAVLKACDAIRDKLFRAAADGQRRALAGRNAADLSLASGRVVVADGGGEKPGGRLQARRRQRNRGICGVRAARPQAGVREGAL